MIGAFIFSGYFDPVLRIVPDDQAALVISLPEIEFCSDCHGKISLY
jgi:hypothetical protein